MQKDPSQYIQSILFIFVLRTLAEVNAETVDGSELLGVGLPASHYSAAYLPQLMELC
jgi:hypothetical protein